MKTIKPQLWYKQCTGYMRDERVKNLFKKYNDEGIGLLFRLTQLLYEYNGKLKYDIISIGNDLNSKKYDKLKDIIENFNLFETIEFNNCIYIQSSEVNENIENYSKYSKAGKKGMETRYNQKEESLELFLNS